MTDKDTSAVIETLKATNEELLKQVGRKQDILDASRFITDWMALPARTAATS